MNLSKKIKKLRELRNLTQEYMAAKLQLSQTAYCKIEKGDTTLSINRLDEIAKILDVSLQEILSFEEENLFGNASKQVDIQQVVPTGISMEEKKLYENLISNLTAENQHLKEMIDYFKSKSA